MAKIQWNKIVQKNFLVKNSGLWVQENFGKIQNENTYHLNVQKNG